MKAFFGAMGGHELALEAGETLLREGPANLFRGIEGVGGRLWLTDRRLVFRSHAVALQAGESVWPLASITSAEPAMTMWIVPNGLRVNLRDGTVQKLVVHDRAGWAKDIESAHTRAAF